MQIQASDYEITDNQTSTKITMGDVETINVTVNSKIMLCIDSSEGDLSIRVYPLTKGELWDAPFTEFNVDFAEITKLETEMEG